MATAGKLAGETAIVTAAGQGLGRRNREGQGADLVDRWTPGSPRPAVRTGLGESGGEVARFRPQQSRQEHRERPEPDAKALQGPALGLAEGAHVGLDLGAGQDPAGFGHAERDAARQASDASF